MYINVLTVIIIIVIVTVTQATVIIIQVNPSAYNNNKISSY